MKSVNFYHCQHCGNLVANLLSGGGSISCCRQPMEKLTAGSGTGEFALVPAMQNGELKVVVGSHLAPITELCRVDCITNRGPARHCSVAPGGFAPGRIFV